MAREGYLTAWLRLTRPGHWVKNGFILAPLFFSGSVTETTRVTAALLAFAFFSLVASGVYCVNDVADAKADRVHPTKRGRPVAAGLISTRAGLAVGLTLILVGAVGSFQIAPGVGWVTIAYVVLNAFYNLWIKSLVLLDVFTIAAFFELRLLAGVEAIDVEPSVWLLLCGGLLALFLGFSKRLHELSLLGDQAPRHRAVLGQYSAGLLRQLAVILLSVTVVSYIMYTLTSETAGRIADDSLAYSTVFVLYGVFRYLYLVHSDPGRGDPTDTLLNDPGLLITAGLWIAYCSWVIYRPI